MSYPILSRLIFGSILTFTIVLVFTASAISKDVPKNQYDTNPVIARVDSEPLRISDIEDKQINDLRKQLFEVLEIQLKKAIVTKLGKKHKAYAENSISPVSIPFLLIPGRLSLNS